MLNMSLSRLVFIADKERTVNTAFSKFSSLLVGNAGARDDRIAALEAKVDQFQLQLEKVSRTKDVEGKSGPKITVSRRQENGARR
ncbi:hypothetical protein MAR_004700 [Mya arenaria]|uniref:Uncharacterized protein n=1 Tax=Mya arenaria TaxID=6604 RepID=A0ABY7EXK0_MYAAR|nr:hypothetical protein MAR_004700 [Mya arenaria]